MQKQIILSGLTFTLLFATLMNRPASSAGASATLTQVLGVVQARTVAGWRGAAVSQRLYPGMTIRTGDRSRSEIKYDDGSVVRLGARSLMAVREARNLNLLRGKTWVQKQPNAQQFKVRTPVAHATVLGTELFVSHSDANISHVTTLDGHVEVTDETGHKEMVNPGEWVEIEPGKKMEKPTKFDWNELRRNERFLLDMNFVPAEGEDIDTQEWN